MAKFIIDRSKWRCGGSSGVHHGKGDTLLLNPEGFMCCLGICAEQLGASVDDLLGIECPEECDSEAVELFVNDAGHDNKLSCEAMKINDDATIADDTRQASLVDIFRRHGHELEFTGKFST